LDPAAGTLTFPAEAAKVAVEEFVGKYGESGKERLIKEHILKNFYAFELMMAPYAVGHLKMSFLLEELGYRLRDEDRFKLYLTNTLEMKELEQIEIPGLSSLSEESHLAGEVKRETPILAILGNPPYSGISTNIGGWITEKIEDYKYVDGKHFGERKHWLQDDYVKFIRFAQWKIDQAGEGVLGFITNHSYLDNPTFRGMRQSLMNSFDEIYILDLHGNSLKKEKCPDGSKDENVFDIQQGVAIALFIKNKGEKKDCKVYYSEIWGLREKKYDWLLKNDIKTTKHEKLNPTSSYYFFVTREEKGGEIYDNLYKISDIFPVNVTGIQTSRDNFVIDFDKDVLKRRIAMFRNLSMPDEIVKHTFNLKDTRGWKFSEARKELSKDEHWDNYFTNILYRPFDIRHIYYTKKMVDWPRPEVMPHMMKDNISICVGRAGQVVGLDKPWNIVFCANYIEDLNLFYRGGNVNFPLYLYPSIDKNHIFNHDADVGERKPNIHPGLFSALSESYGQESTPEDIFYYIYGVLYSTIYRTKYAEFLKIDFPRIPFTKDKKLFAGMSKLGEKLVNLHLLKSRELDQPIAKFQGQGDNKVEKLKYDEKNKRLYFNSQQYVEGVEKEVWEYQIGGYQVCHKWLSDRKKRILTLEDIKHYCRVVTALSKTIEVQKKIDEIYPDVEKETIEIELGGDK
jgi:predicted helicase